MHKKNSIIDDSPISKDKDDQLEGLLKISADKIKKVILENKFAASFTIGLNGEWGDGGEPQYQINTTIQPKKTISTTRTLAKAIRDYEPIRERVSTYAFKCSEKLRKQNSCCRYITVFISTDRFQNHYYGNSLTITLMNPSTKTHESFIFLVELHKV
ncbi:DinB/UmuC family translesion DNA polymerase, partial [Capnocytophaga canimorsus]|uniref:DinB/UmuC family translesion DNA polymerase n=1 Tax=Capnocytophaga canimorsus TaxID=28188 RepID=UPI00402B4FD9